MTDSSFSPDVVEDEEADVLMLAASADTLEAAATVINANSGDKPVLGGDEIYNRYILEETGSDSQSLTVAVPWH